MKELFAVIGDPIAHSKSPIMHNEWFKAHEINAHYHAFHITEHHLEDAIKGFRAIGISGFNVTVPHKVGIIPLLDEIDPLAQTIGAVNTVVNKEGKFIGYNTDGIGFIKGLEPYLSSIQDKKVLMVGAGGAARAIFFSMAFEGVKHIDIVNRSVQKAQSLRDECPYDVSTEVLTGKEAEDRLDQYDLIIQTTSIGMAPYEDQVPLSLHNISPNAFVSDIIYNPSTTKLLSTARSKGATIQNGMDMFVLQGALAFEKWTGILPEIKQMKEKLEHLLGGIKC